MTSAHLVPDTCAVAFKEWAGVCEALERGSQSLILRKGGISEGPGGFVPEHRAFWLYPTHVHEAEQGLRVPSTTPRNGQDTAKTVLIGSLATVETIDFVDQEERLGALAGLHVWTDETVAKRFHYRTPGIWVLGVRVYRRESPVAIAVTPDQQGCRTWVPLDPPLAAAGVAPVLGDDDFIRRMDQLRGALTLDR